jgi:hypothetical protein
MFNTTDSQPKYIQKLFNFNNFIIHKNLQYILQKNTNWKLLQY